MAADVTARIRVEGLGEFRSAMSQAAAAVKQSTAEEKRAEAQYKETGDAAAYQQQKTQALTEKLAAQQKQVETAQKAIKKLEEAKVAPDDRRLVQWKTQLANAEAEVSKTRSELGKLNGTSTAQITQGLGKVEGAAKEAGAELHGIAGKLDRETLVKGLDAVTDKMESVMRKAAQMGKAIWDASTDAANWADATRDAATAAGMTTTEYQQMAYAAQFFGLSIDDLTNKQGKLVKAMDEGGQIMVGDWAVDTIDRMTGEKRSFNNIMMDLVDGLGQITDPVARDQAAMELFGKSYKDLNAMIEDGGKGWQEKINEAPVVREETVNSLADTADVLKEMDSRLETLKMEVLASLAEPIKTIGEAVSTLAQGLTDFLQTKEGQQLLKDLGDALTEIVTAITGQDFSGIVETAKGAVEGLTKALDWLLENKDTVIAAVTGIAGAFGALKFMSFGIQAANTVSAFNRLLGIPGNTNGSAGASASASNIGSSIGQAAGTGGQMIMFGGSGGSILLSLGLANLWSDTDPMLRGMKSDIEKYGHIRTGDDMAAEMYARTGFKSPANLSGRQARLYNLADYGLSDRPGQGLFGMFSGPDKGTVNATIRLLQTELLENVLDPDLYAELMSADTAKGDNVDLLKRVKTGILEADESLFADLEESSVTAGEAVPAGLAEGIRNNSDVAVSEAEAMAGAVKSVVTQVLQVHSPSRVMTEIGGYVGLGLAEGIDQSIAQVEAAAARMSVAAARPVAAAAGSTHNSSVTNNHYFTVGEYVQNSESDLNALARRVMGVQRSERQAYGKRK